MHCHLKFQSYVRCITLNNMIAVQILHKDIGSFLQSCMFNRDIRHTVFDIFRLVHIVGGFQILFSLLFYVYI